MKKRLLFLGFRFILSGRSYRLFGDINGNGVNNAYDFAQFRLAYGSSSTDPAYQAAFDEDANGTINAFDLAEFRLRYGDNVLP